MHFCQLQHLVSDPICQQCMELFQREQRQSKESSGGGGLCATAYMRLGAELSYQRKAEKAMADENCFKIYIVSTLEIFYLTINSDFIVTINNTVYDSCIYTWGHMYCASCICIYVRCF